MKEYRFSQEKAKDMIKKQIISSIPLYSICAFVGLYLANSKNDGQIFGNPLVLSITVVLCVIAITIGFIITLKKGPKVYTKITYQLSDTEIVQKTANGKEVSILFVNIVSHNLNRRGVQIKGGNKRILILSQLDEFAELSNAILRRIKG